MPINFKEENENPIPSQVWCILIAQLLATVIQKIAQTKKAFSLVRMHLISKFDMVEMLRSTSRVYKVQVGEPPE